MSIVCHSIRGMYDIFPCQVPQHHQKKKKELEFKEGSSVENWMRGWNLSDPFRISTNHVAYLSLYLVGYS